jgi:hypothetical protein
MLVIFLAISALGFHIRIAWLLARVIPGLMWLRAAAAGCQVMTLRFYVTILLAIVALFGACPPVIQLCGLLPKLLFGSMTSLSLHLSLIEYGDRSES